MVDVCRNALSVFTVYLVVCPVWREFIQDNQCPSMQLWFRQSHNAQRLFGPLHSGKERVGFDIIHTSHTCPQPLHWVVLEQLLQQRSGLLWNRLRDVESGVATDSCWMAPQQGHACQKLKQDGTHTPPITCCRLLTDTPHLWCTVHIGNGLFVIGLLHVTPTTKVGKLNMTCGDRKKQKVFSSKCKCETLISSSTSCQPSTVKCQSDSLLFKLFTHLVSTSFLHSFLPLYISARAFQAHSPCDYSCLAATR